MEIEFASTKELVAELQKRSTFAGLIMWSPDEHKKDGQTHNDFQLFTSVNDEQTIKLLEIATESLKRQT